MIRFAIPIRSFATKSPAQTNLTFFLPTHLPKNRQKKKLTVPYQLHSSREKKVERARIVIVPHSFWFHYGTKNNDNVP